MSEQKNFSQNNNDKWLSYDSIASSYERFHVPYIFYEPSRDLVLMLELPLGGTVLDVGTGTGVAAHFAIEAVGQVGIVVGIDPSFEMLRLAQGKGMVNLIRGKSP